MTNLYKLFVYASLLVSVYARSPVRAMAQTGSIRMSAGRLRLTIEKKNTRYRFDDNETPILDADQQAGILLAESPVSIVSTSHCSQTQCVLQAANELGEKLQLTFTLAPHHVEILAEPQNAEQEVRFVTGGAAPGYGLADHAVEQKLFSTLPTKRYDTDVSGFVDDKFLSGQGQTRLVSNFVIYPRQRFAELLIDPTMKIVETSDKQIVQGVVRAKAQIHLHYFFGNMHEIYAEYLKARNAAGYPVLMPKYEAFGVGWEAFGALAWDTDQKTVSSSIDRYLSIGYPLRWAVIGSGFWPSGPEMHETTSFGLWEPAKYPDPKGLMAHLHYEHLVPMLGLRITFITMGPFAKEGVSRGYFLSQDGKAQVFTGGWPKLPYYLLDAHNPAALEWYMSLVKRWQDYGVEGFKEDFYGYGKYDLRDDKVDPTNNRLMEQHQLVIERNGYLSSNGDLQRINDFNYDQNQDRGPVNALAFAYSGFPLVYPDIVGGTFGENHFSVARTPQMNRYMMRNAQWASLHSSMGMGEPPWTFPTDVAEVMLNAAKLHARLAPYLFNNARRFAIDGYPWTMTPLPIAFPDDPLAYGRENASDRGYEWMIGEALLATPLYGDDYATANARDIYLPKGQWMDFDTGKLYGGQQMLRGFALPPGKTPLFVGGSGVVLEDIDGTIQVCIYPVAQSAIASMTLPNKDEAISVRVIGLPVGTAWSGIRVRNGEGERLNVTVTGKGFAFVPRAGEHYTIEAIR
jgi:alpha-glucosidase (family GH31 glycosyl hydrolase)